MEQIIKVETHRLTENFVEIDIQKYIVFEGREIKDGEKQSTSAHNNPSGRERIKNLDIPQKFIDSVFSVWGDAPTVEDPEMPKVMN